MSTKRSAGILMYRRAGGALEVFLAHPGGPFWEGKDDGAWSIPKGEYEEGEEALAAARREFQEETGFPVDGAFIPLSPVRQPSGKLVSAWAVEGDCDPSLLTSNTFTMEWPPRSGRQAEFPEVDRGAWFGVAEARRKIMKGQLPLLEELCRLLGGC
ncbi:MAG TPA: NUDIX domain-containing protein [bacterium]